MIPSPSKAVGLGLLVGGLALALPGYSAAAEPPPPPATELPEAIEVPLSWRLDYDLCEPETAVRDAQEGAIYVSNVCGFSKDGHGFLTQVSDRGEILERFWVDGLDAPAGLAIQGRTLWVVDIDVVRGFDLDTAEQIATLTFPADFGVRALNDLVIAPDGTIYVSDSSQRAIYRLREGKAALFVQDDRLEFANGLLLGQGILWAGSGKGLFTVNLLSGAIGGPVGPPQLTDVDGIESDGSGGLLLSIVGGDVWHLPANGPLEILTTPGLASSNLGYFPEIGLVVVPTGADGTLLAFPFPPPQAARARAARARAALPTAVRIATFNVRELSTDKLDAVDENGIGVDPQLRAAAEIVRRIRPDILVLQEIDHDVRQPEDLTVNGRRFVRRYLAVPNPDGGPDGGTDGSAPLDYPYLYAAPSNTGVPSGHDLNNDGQVAGPDQVGERTYGEDSFGFGLYPGQFATILLSRYPIRSDHARTFQLFHWAALPGNHLPREFYSPEEVEILRLSSKSHWDVPVEIGPATLHLWISHPTPPVYDGPEDRNGRRNYDEVAFWLAYLENDPALVDDAGLTGGWAGGGRAGDDPFLIVGDLNADTAKGDALEVGGERAIERLLADPRLQDTAPFLHSTGALVESARDAAAPERAGPPDFPERGTAVFLGGMRIDYLLPSRGIQVVDGGVFWPAPDEDPEGARLADAASDHRLVWLDLRVPHR